MSPGLRSSPRRSPSVLVALLLACAVGLPAAAEGQDRLYLPATDDALAPILDAIRAETVRIDISAWYLTEHAISIAIRDAYLSRGVPVRLLGDRASIFEIDPLTRDQFIWLARQGIPIRLRYHPTWYPYIVHWKAAVFAGQNLVEFGSANWTPFELVPVSSTNYKDETVLFTSDSSLVGAFKTKFDEMWADTGDFLDWPDAYRAETGRSWWTDFPDAAPMNISTARLEPNHPMPPEMVWGQGDEFNNALTDAIDREFSFVDLVVYRLSVDNITNALLQKHNTGVSVRLIIEPNEYRNGTWPEFELTGAKLDQLWTAGVPIKQRAHTGLTHMKTLITSSVATNASSNYTAHWQRDHNYFVPASSKPAVHSALRNRFQAMWTSGDFVDFRPLPPEVASLSSPANGAASQSTTPTLRWNRARWAVFYDVHIGTSPSSMQRVHTVNAALVDNPPATYQWTVSPALQAGTTYYWKIVGRTNASGRDASIRSDSSTRSFVTAGTPPTDGGGGGGGGDGGDPDATEQVIYAADVTDIQGWTRTSDATAAAGVLLSTSDQGWSTTEAPLANPSQYFEASFQASAGTRYRVWLRLRAAGSSKWNDAVWVQFSNSVTSGGSPAYRIGTTNGLLVNLENCSACGMSGWGWQNRAWWLSDTGEVWFASTGTQRIRVQVREDGVQIDQIVISPATFLSSPPGPVTNDQTIVPKPDGSGGGGGGGGTTAPEIVVHASDIPSGQIHGTWVPSADSGSPDGVRLATADLGWEQIDNPLASPANYVDVTFDAVANTPYRLWLRLKGQDNSKWNESVWVQFTDARVGGSAAYGIGTTSGLLVNLEDCSNCGVSGWGWQDNSWWLGQSSTVTFPTSGTKTLRIQVREDGVSFDQVVLSPARYLSSAPGPVKNDSTIVQ